ncbi:hypothetical protein ACFQZC_02955 [Streptacidiphilus monticola]
MIVAHTGLDTMNSAAAVWRGVPLRAPMTATWWRVPAARAPVGAEAAEEWLEQQWSRVDGWIGAQAPRPDTGSAIERHGAGG